MALVKLDKKGYGQLELNFAAFRRAGNLVADMRLENGIAPDRNPIENGMILFVNEKENCIELPMETTYDHEDPTHPRTDSDRLTTKGEGYFGINYTAEHMYDEREQGLKNFAITDYNTYPRIGLLHERDTFTTNTVCWDSEDFPTHSGNKAPRSAKYGTPCLNGYIRLVQEMPEKCDFLLLVKDIDATMPDGQPAVKFVKVGGNK